MDPWSIVVDEVTLEGLDGITIPTLWIRLQDRQPPFPLKLDDPTKELIWRFLATYDDFTFYQLPVGREDLVLVDRFKEIDPEIIITETVSNTIKDIYPIHPVPETKDGIQGSCMFFKQRVDITQHVRSNSLTLLVQLEEAMERYGRKLVVVASQTLRFRTLIGSESDPDLKLSDESYCVLEKVGRARWQGELQSDMHGSSSFKTDARRFHYLRKSLVKHQLVTMQSFLKRLQSGQQQHSILLLLNRFHVNRWTKYEILMEHASDFLAQLPHQISAVAGLKNQLNTDDGSFKRLVRYMRVAKYIEFCQIPLEDLDPSAGPCTRKNGKKVHVRCLKLLKPYVKKNLDDEDDEDDDDLVRSSGLAVESRILEKDMLSQAYHLVLSTGTKGIPQRDICLRMNIGKLEARMLVRKLESDGMIKGFMEDEGRQRTTKFISHRCVGVSDHVQMFAKEQARNKELTSSAPQTLNAEPTASKTQACSKSSAKGRRKADIKKKRTEAKEEEEEEQTDGDTIGGSRLQTERGKRRGKSGGSGKKGTTEATQPEETPVIVAEYETTPCSEFVPSDPVESSLPDQTPLANEQSSSACSSSLPQTEPVTEKNPECKNIIIVKNFSQSTVPHSGKFRKLSHKFHQTYRLLRRKNLIVEAIQNLQIIEGLFPLQKMINDEEKQVGFDSKCCKKTIIRLVQNLSREGLLKIYSTTVIQDGITKKVDLIVHPTIHPTDDRVKQAIEQIRFKISSSYSVVRLQQAEEKARELANSTAAGSSSKRHKSQTDRKKGGLKEADFKPVRVRGLSKSLGYQPKMHRLRVIHTFLWYLIYGHPQQNNTSTCPSPSDPIISHPDATIDANETEKSPNSRIPSPACSVKNLDELGGDDVKSLEDLGDDDTEDHNGKTPSHSQQNLKVYSDEDSWRRFVPPVRVHKEYGTGWAMVGDLLLCLPLSLYVQAIQVNYKVEGLEEYLDDPVKQHFLIRALPAKTRRQLLYRRRYIFSFYWTLMRLVYMGLLQFGSVQKFQEKDQVFVYLRRNTTIVDTCHAEPHYWLVTESPDKPFDRRHYTLNTAADVENYWFDLMCVCLNTPLGVFRAKRHVTEEEEEPTIVHDRNVFVGMAYLLKGCREPCDDGSIPGDGKGAGGLDSEFFCHLKRNWLWTNHLLSVSGKPSGSEAQETKNRLRGLLNRNALSIALNGGDSAKRHYLTTKQTPIAQTIEVGIEPASRNQEVVGGKKQKRRRAIKDQDKAPRKKKKVSAGPKKRTPAHDEADHKALKMMTRQRVYWSVQEDSLIMVCCVASTLLNSKLKRPFVPHCGVRDLLQAEFEMSQDKTSLAVGRRSRYILKNPQTLLNYRICLAEAYQDETLMKLLEENKPLNPQDPEDCAKSFSEYIRLLREKFTTVLSTSDLIIPDSKQELFSRFKISAIDTETWVPGIDNLQCTNDIHAIVLHNLIQSTLAMTNSQIKSSRSFQTFHMYSKFDQELLCQVFIQCRNKGLVNRRRVSQPCGPKKNRALPILPMSYQLSQSYFRCFSWRFPHSLCTDSFRFLRSLIDNGTEDDRPVTEFYHETEKRSEGDEDVLEKKMALKRKRKQNPVEEVNNKSISEKEVQTDRRNDEPLKEMSMEEDPINQSDKGKESNLKGGLVEDSLTGETTDNNVLETPKGAAPPSKDPPDVSGMLQFSLQAPGGSCMVSLSLLSLGLLQVHMSIPKQVVMVDSTLVENDVVKNMAALEEDDDDEDDGEDNEGKKRLQVKAHQASHTNYLMMRGYCAPGIVKLRNLNTTDNIVVESCRMRMQLRNTPAHHMFPEEMLPPLDLTIRGPSLIPTVLTNTIHSCPSSVLPVEESEKRLTEQRGYTQQDLEACAQLRRTLDEAGERGLDAKKLNEAHLELQEPQCGRTKTLQQYMKDLEEEGEVVSVGSLALRWVLMRHAAPWLLTVNNKQWSQTRLTPDRLKYLKKQHRVPFMRKRSSRTTHPEEPAAKRQATDKESRSTSRSASEEVERTEERSEDTQINLEEDDKEKEGGEQQGKETEEKEGGEQQGKESEEKEQKLDTREEEGEQMAGSPPARSLDDDENVSFVSRPWRLVDGKLNRQVCKGMLEAILFHIMSRPGITLRALFEHYKDLLQPTSVMELLQALAELGCVTRKVLVKSPKPSLFSRPVLPPSSEVKTEDLDSVYYEPTISGCLRLCQVLPNERHWTYCMP